MCALALTTTLTIDDKEDQMAGARRQPRALLSVQARDRHRQETALGWLAAASARPPAQQHNTLSPSHKHVPITNLRVANLIS